MIEETHNEYQVCYKHPDRKTYLRCNKCGRLFTKQLLTFDCPYCDGQGEPSELGKEFFIKSIEIE